MPVNRMAAYILLCAALAGVVGLFFGRDTAVVPLLILAILLFVGILALCLNDPQIGLLAFLFSLPFERIPSLQVGGATLRLSQLLLISLIFSLIWRGLASRRMMLRPSVYLGPYILFLLAVLLSFWHMQAISRGISVAMFMLFTSLAIWVIPAIINTKELLQKSVRALFVVTILISIFGLYQYVGDIGGLPNTLTGLRDLYTKVVFGFPRIQATELEPLYLANFLIIPLSLAISLAIRQTKKYSWALLTAVSGLGGLVLILTLSRGGYVGMLASLSVLAVGSAFWLLRPRALMSGIGIMIVLMIAVIGIASFTNLGQKSIDETVRHFTQIGQDASTLQRFTTFDGAREAFDTSPFVGVGVGNFGPFVAGYPNQLPISGWAIVNNAPLEILAETGIFGLFAALIFLILLFARSFKALFATKDPLLRGVMVGLIAALVGVLVQYQFFSTFYIMHIWALFGLVIAVQNIILHNDDKEATP